MSDSCLPLGKAWEPQLADTESSPRQQSVLLWEVLLDSSISFFLSHSLTGLPRGQGSGLRLNEHPPVCQVWLGPSLVSFHLAPAPRHCYYQPHFTGKGTEVQGLSGSPKGQLELPPLTRGAGGAMQCQALSQERRPGGAENLVMTGGKGNRPTRPPSPDHSP